ncbi:MAG: hypothetical protein ACRC0L_09845 [Angustibacter sp.]
MGIIAGGSVARWLGGSVARWLGGSVARWPGGPVEPSGVTGAASDGARDRAALSGREVLDYFVR